MRVVITGAAGRIGRHVVAELEGSHDLTLIDRVRIPRHRSVRADLSRGRPEGRRALAWRALDLPRWERMFEAADVVLHLAANPAPTAPWRAVLRQNVQATWNVLDAAARRGVGRVVLASSLAGVLGLRTARELGPDPTPPTAPPRPRTAYGLSKAMVEAAGRMLVDTGRLRSVLTVRIGMFREETPADEYARRWWVGPRDVGRLFRRCVEAEFAGYHVVNAVSRDGAGLIDLAYTRELLGWEPEDA